MNYILSLKEKNETQYAQLKAIEQEINDFISFLHSDKFAGVDSQGNRKDWISTGDVLNRMMEIRSLT